MELEDAQQGWTMFEQEGFNQLLGPVMGRFEEDGAGVFRFQTTAAHRNRSGLIHGGVLMALADQCMGRTARREDSDRFHVTLQIDVQFIKAVNVGGTVELRCRVTSARRTVEFVDAEIFGDGELLAIARGIWRKFPQNAEILIGDAALATVG